MGGYYSKNNNKPKNANDKNIPNNNKPLTANDGILPVDDRIVDRDQMTRNNYSTNED